MLTHKEKQERYAPILKKIKAFMQENGSSPTYAEIAAMMRASTRSAAFMAVREMAGMGWLTYTPGQARGIKLLDSA